MGTIMEPIMGQIMATLKDPIERFNQSDAYPINMPMV